MAKSAPDGNTFLVNDTTNAMLPHLFKKLPWDHANGLVPVTNIVDTPLVVLVGAGSPYKTIKDLVDAARRSPGQLTFGSGGMGSSTHLGGELLKQNAQVKGAKVRALLVTAPQRIAALPDTPTSAEAGLKDFTATNWFGVAAPKGTPPPLSRISSAARRRHGAGCFASAPWVLVAPTDSHLRT